MTRDQVVSGNLADADLLNLRILNSLACFISYFYFSLNSYGVTMFFSPLDPHPWSPLVSGLLFQSPLSQLDRTIVRLFTQTLRQRARPGGFHSECACARVKSVTTTRKVDQT